MDLLTHMESTWSKVTPIRVLHNTAGSPIRGKFLNWKIKARVQGAVALLPSRLSYSVYYWLQRRFGGLRAVTPLPSCAAAVGFWERIEARHGSPLGKTFLEIGTGRRLNVPVILWLFGSGEITTVDLNPYLKLELIRKDLSFLCTEGIDALPAVSTRVLPDRLRALRDLLATRYALRDLLDLCSIQYLTPADATCLPLADASVDYHISVTVFEHIPREIILGILKEGSRVLRVGGLFVHRIDYSDHFAHSDSGLSLINFLQYDQHAWHRIAGNRYMYMNRLRDDDYVDLFSDAGLRTISHEPDVNSALLQELDRGLHPIHADFAGKSMVVLATTGAWFVAAMKR
jgi:SAM-dependent methyltransferase